MERFTGTVKKLCDVDVAGLLRSLPPYEDWPQQHPIKGVPLRPAMLRFEFPSLSAAIMAKHFPGGRECNHLVSVVMPGDRIPPHVDNMGPDWRCRVHVPLQADANSKFRSGKAHQMKVGSAYMVNVMAEHSVENDGKKPRIHFLFDVYE